MNIAQAILNGEDPDAVSPEEHEEPSPQQDHHQDEEYDDDEYHSHESLEHERDIPDTPESAP